MSEVLVRPKTDQPPPSVSGQVAVVAAYLIVVALPIVLKLAHLTRVAAWSWQKATCFLWGPWVLLVVLSLIGLTMRWVSRLRDHK